MSKPIGIEISFFTLQYLSGSRSLTANGLQFTVEADVIALNCQPAKMFLESTTVQLVPLKWSGLTGQYFYKYKFVFDVAEGDRGRLITFDFC